MQGDGEAPDMIASAEAAFDPGAHRGRVRRPAESARAGAGALRLGACGYEPAYFSSSLRRSISRLSVSRLSTLNSTRRFFERFRAVVFGTIGDDSP